MKKNKMERILNIYHYSLYLIHYKINAISYRWSLLRLFYSLPFAKKRLEKKKLESPEKAFKDSFGNKDYGISMLVAGGVMGVTFFLLFVALFEFITKLIIRKEFYLTNYFFGTLILLAYGICYLFVFRKDKYLVYFDEFEGWSKKQRRVNLITSFFFGISTIGLFILSFIV